MKIEPSRKKENPQIVRNKLHEIYGVERREKVEEKSACILFLLVCLFIGLGFTYIEMF